MKSFHIVIAEDDASMARVLRLHCQAIGGVVRVAPDAMMALTMIHRHPPDIVILDINLPAGNGFGVLEMVRADTRLANIPVIVFSGTEDQEIVERCRQQNAVFIKKSPHESIALKQVIRNQLQLTAKNTTMISGGTA